MFIGYLINHQRRLNGDNKYVLKKGYDMEDTQITDSKEELRRSKEEIRSMFVDSIVVIFSFILTAAAIIPIIGPALVAYVMGLNKYRNESHGLSKTHMLVVILISGFFLLIISLLVDHLTLEFFNPKKFWRIIIIVLTANLIASLSLFLIGDRRAKNKKIKMNKNKIFK